MKSGGLVIVATFAVKCPVHGLVAVKGTREAAVHTRRQHVKQEHADDPVPERAPRPRGTCTGCKKQHSLGPNGLVRSHGVRVSVGPTITRGHCPGSHKPPVPPETPEA
jgi:hypothetical protein